MVDQVDAAAPPALSPAATTAAIDRAMDSWDGLRCAAIPIVKVPDLGLNWGFAAGGLNPLGYADVVHGGWFSLPPQALGLTVTFIFIDGGGPTDVDQNGKIDVAFREIYYNADLPWAIDTDFDVETVAFHEAGHGLSQGHFGKIFITPKNGKLHFAPRAAMNAIYFGVLQRPLDTDKGGHCSLWGSWPNH